MDWIRFAFSLYRHHMPDWICVTTHRRYKCSTPFRRHEMKDIKLNSLLNVMARELDDFSQNWSGDPQTIPQRFDDLFTLVKSAKAVLNNGAMGWAQHHSLIQEKPRTITGNPAFFIVVKLSIDHARMIAFKTLKNTINRVDFWYLIEYYHNIFKPFDSNERGKSWQRLVTQG